MIGNRSAELISEPCRLSGTTSQEFSVPLLSLCVSCEGSSLPGADHSLTVDGGLTSHQTATNFGLCALCLPFQPSNPLPTRLIPHATGRPALSISSCHHHSSMTLSLSSSQQFFFPATRDSRLRTPSSGIWLKASGMRY